METRTVLSMYLPDKTSGPVSQRSESGRRGVSITSDSATDDLEIPLKQI